MTHVPGSGSELWPEQPPASGPFVLGHWGATALPGAVQGLVLGGAVRLGDRRGLHSQGITHLVFPVVQLLVLAALAGLAGIAAAVAPSRRAARVDVLRAVTTE